MPRTGKYPGGPISPNKVAALLRDRYYLGEVCYKGVWRRNGRHPALVEPELFERVQRVLEAHGFVRYRTHNHYLKGCCGVLAARTVSWYTRPEADTVESSTTSSAEADRRRFATCPSSPLR